MISSEEIEDMVKSNNVLLLKFTASWCNSCKKYDHYINDLNVCVFSVDVGLNEDLQEEYDITVLPTVLIYKNNNLIDRIEGFITKSDFIKKLNIINI